MVHSPHAVLSEAGPDGESELTEAQEPRCIHYLAPPHGLAVVLQTSPPPFATKSMLCFAF